MKSQHIFSAPYCQLDLPLTRRERRRRRWLFSKIERALAAAIRAEFGLAPIPVVIVRKGGRS